MPRYVKMNGAEGRVAVTLSLTRDDLATLDELARIAGERRWPRKSRSWVVRQLIECGRRLQAGREVRNWH